MTKAIKGSVKLTLDDNDCTKMIDWMDRMEEALSSEVVKVPEGLSFEELRQFILDHAEETE